MIMRGAVGLGALVLGAQLVAGAPALAADAADWIKGQWRHPNAQCQESSLTISVQGERIEFDWVWDEGAKSQWEVERIDQVSDTVVETTAIATSGDEQEDEPGDRFRYTLDGEQLTIELLSADEPAQILVRCGVSA